MLESAPSIKPPFARIVSYNVLSSHLCEPEHFVKCDPADLAPATRLARIEAALAPQMEREAVICLQEVSVQWVGELTQFFESKGYTFVSGNYGAPFNGYMGVSLAWPRARFESVAVDITRASDARGWPKPPPSPPPPNLLVRGWRRVKQLWAKPIKPPLDVAHEAKRRHNFVVSAKLRCKRTGAEFAVSTYHMPCLFGSVPKVQVMVIHAALAAQHALAFADGAPCILAGDFNFAPGTAPYNVVTAGALPDGDEHTPPSAVTCDGWSPTVAPPLESAYVAAGEPEPDFTNLATTKFQSEPFVGTLDYIFLSKGDWRATGVRALPSRKEVLPVCSSYPSATEPSDHVAIWADVELVRQ